MAKKINLAPKYYYVTMPNMASPKVSVTHDHALDSDLKRRAYGNYFYDKEEASMACRAVALVFSRIRRARREADKQGTIKAAAV